MQHQRRGRLLVALFLLDITREEIQSPIATMAKTMTGMKMLMMPTTTTMVSRVGMESQMVMKSASHPRLDLTPKLACKRW